MQNPAQLAKSYREAAIRTATPAQLILMLFDGALKSMALAQAAFLDPNPITRNEQIHNRLVNALDIIQELQSSLNMNVPGDFSPRMFALYDFMKKHLREANLKKEQQPIRDVERMLVKIRDAWAEMLETTASVAA